MACGTGALAVDFAKSGYDVTALDLSEEMLMIASERAFEEEVPVQFVQGNMLDLSEVGQYQAITCFSDSLCYMANRQEVQQVFDEVYQALEEEGTFILMFILLTKLIQFFQNIAIIIKQKNLLFYGIVTLVKRTQHRTFLNIFVKEQETDEHFVRYDELHQERTYSLDNYLRMLESAGFMNVKVYADFTDEAPTETSERWFFVCQRD